MSNAQGTIFNQTFLNVAVKEIEFNPAWKNGTGYFDAAVEGPEAPALEVREMIKTIDDYGRRMIIVGTRFGNVVVFDRFTKQEDDGVYVVNMPRGKIFTVLVDSASVGEHGMLNILGSWGNIKNNIGNTVEIIARSFNA